MLSFKSSIPFPDDINDNECLITCWIDFSLSTCFFLHFSRLFHFLKNKREIFSRMHISLIIQMCLTNQFSSRMLNLNIKFNLIISNSLIFCYKASFFSIFNVHRILLFGSSHNSACGYFWGWNFTLNFVIILGKYFDNL